jgi:simple sugar transport system permease protein
MKRVDEESTPVEPKARTGLAGWLAQPLLGGWRGWASAFGALLLALLVGSFFLLLNGYSPIEAYKNILIGAFGSKFAIAETLLKTTPLIFTGLAVAVAAQAGLFNIGAEGQLLVGALAAAMVAAQDWGLPPLVHPLLALGAGFLFGGLWGGIAGVIKARFGAHEVIVTIMLNYIAALLTSYLVTYPWKAEGMVPQTNPVVPSAALAHLLRGSQLSTGIFIALIATVAIAWLVRKTVFGYEMRAVGYNPSASHTAGIRSLAIGTLAIALGGALAGVGGGVEVLGVHGRFIQGFSPGFGFDGIAVAVLANNQPALVPLTALLFGVLRAGGAYLERSTSIPGDFAVVIQGLVILFAASPRIFSVLRASRRSKMKEEAKEYAAQ